MRDFHSKHFVLFFAVVLSVPIWDLCLLYHLFNSAGAFTATTFVGSVAFLMAVGGVFFWLGNTIPILNNYLGGACSFCHSLRLFDEFIWDWYLNLRQMVSAGHEGRFAICTLPCSLSDLSLL